MASPDTNIAGAIKRALLFLVVATVVLYLGLAGLTYWAWQGQESNRDALCALRGDLEKRVSNSQKFLSENPEGIPGISATTIRDGIANQQRTIAALRGISC